MTRAVSALMGTILADELSKRRWRRLTIDECETIAAAMVSRTAAAAPPVCVMKAGITTQQRDKIEAELRRAPPLQLRPLPPTPPLSPRCAACDRKADHRRAAPDAPFRNHHGRQRLS